MQRPGGHRRRAAVIRLTAGPAIVGCAMVIGACGSAGGSGQAAVGATTAQGKSSPLGLSQCMRAHGVPQFADPSAGPVGTAVAGTQRALDAGSPAFMHAASVCGALRTR